MRTLIKIFSISIIFSSITGCASMKYGMGYSKYANEPNRLNEHPALNFQEAVQFSKSTTLQFNKAHHSAVQLNDALFNYDQRIGHYKLFKVPNTNHKSLKVTVNSMCSCLGMQKRIMPVRSFVFNDKGELLEQGSIKFKFDQFSFIPSNFEGIWRGKDIQSDNIFILVGFEGVTRSNLDISTVAQTSSGAAYLPMSIGVRPIGEILIEVNDLKQPQT